MLLRLVDNAAPFLSQPFVDANFAFRGTVLNGTPQNTDRWKRGVDLVTAAIPDDVSRIYVQRYFPPEAKREADALVRNVIAAMDRRLAGLTWMAPETRARARAQARRLHPQDRLSRQLARLFERPDQPRQPAPEHRQRDRIRISAQSEQARPPGRPHANGA